MTPFDSWTLEDAKIAVGMMADDDMISSPGRESERLNRQLMAVPVGRLGRLASYRAFVDGDHWQNWEGWTGPMPLANDTDAAQVLTEIQRGFVSRNAIGECVGRHVNGVLGRDVKYSVTTKRKIEKGQQPTEDEQTRIDEAKAALDLWVEARKLNQEFDKVGQTLLIAGVAHQRAFVAPGEINENGIVPTADLETSIGRVYFDFPLAKDAVLWTDPRTQKKCSIYLYRETSSSRPSEAKAEQGEDRAELTYLDGDQTIIRIVGGKGPTMEEGEIGFSYPLGKRLLMGDMHRRPLLNPQVVSQQKLLNLALTMKQRNVILGGFLERVATNAQMNGHYEAIEDGTRRFVPDALPVGAGALTSLTGYITRDAEGNESIASPNMLWRDPVDVKTFLDTEGSAYEAILAECNQLHYAMSKDGNSSAESRQVAMAAYLIDLLQTKQQIDAGWTWQLETTLALAAALSGQAGRYDDLRVAAECSVDPGPISADMIRVVIELWREGRLTLKTGLSWIGVDDVDAEIAGLEAEELEAEEGDGRNEPFIPADLDTEIAKLETVTA